MSNRRFTRPLLIEIEHQHYPGNGGHIVSLNNEQVAWRPWDGSDEYEVESEIVSVLGALLREKLGLDQTAPEDEDDPYI